MNNPTQSEVTDQKAENGSSSNIAPTVGERPIAQPSVPDVAAEAEAIVNALSRLCHRNSTLDMSTGTLNPTPLDTCVVTDVLLEAAVKANTDPTKLVLIAKELAWCHQFVYNYKIPVDDRKCWRIPYWITVKLFSGCSQPSANVGHLAWAPRRPRPPGGHTQFDTSITFRGHESPCDEWEEDDQPQKILRHLSAVPQYSRLSELLRYFHPSANNAAILVKMFLGMHLAERYDDHEKIKGMAGVIDDSNRPKFVKYDALYQDIEAAGLSPYMRGVNTGTHHIYADCGYMGTDTAHCLYLASVEWPFWPDVDFDQNLVPPQLAVKIAGIPGKNVMFVDAVTEQQFGDTIRLPSVYSWRNAIQWFSGMELAYEECCYAREIAARITFYWPEHAPQSHHRDIDNIDASALTTFFNSDLTLPLPKVGRSLLHRFYSMRWPEQPDPECRRLWRNRMNTVLSLNHPEGIVYDNLVGRTIGYAQGCVAQSCCISTDILLDVAFQHANLTLYPPFNSGRDQVNDYTRNLCKKTSEYEPSWYIAGSKIVGFMPSFIGINLCRESRSRSRNATNRHRLVDRTAHRLISSSQVLDIMTVMPDACYLGFGQCALSNASSNVFRVGPNDWRNVFVPEFVVTSKETIHCNARVLANFVRCLGISEAENQPKYYVQHQSVHDTKFDPWKPLPVIHDPILIHCPEEATWTPFRLQNGTNMVRRCFKVEESEGSSSPWATFVGPFYMKAKDESMIPFAGTTNCIVLMPHCAPRRRKRLNEDPLLY